ncbi:hypothetical protein D3C76_1274950 [compost metagenome]
MKHWFGDRPKNQSNTHACTEKHGYPGTETEFRLVVLTAQLKGAETAERKYQQYNEQAAHHGQIKPFEIFEDGIGGRLEHRGSLITFQGTKQNEGHDYCNRNNGYGWIEAFE